MFNFPGQMSTAECLRLFKQSTGNPKQAPPPVQGQPPCIPNQQAPPPCIPNQQAPPPCSPGQQGPPSPVAGPSNQQAPPCCSQGQGQNNNAAQNSCVPPAPPRPPVCSDPNMDSIRANMENVINLTPRLETGALQFVGNNPQSDGRGIVIAILDTGVDPGAAGLVQTSDGKIKVIERYDCSGAGDVDTSTVIEATPGEGGGMVLKGLTGRSVVIPATWNNPSGKYHIGFKPVYELYPPDLKERMRKERREKHWDDTQNIAVGTAEQNLATEQLKPCIPDAPLNEKFTREDIAAKSEILEKLDKEHMDLGPVLDCILFQDAQNVWQICLSFGTGEAVQLQEYNYAHEYSAILPLDRFNVSVNVWEDGNLLEIVGMNDPHGTHVAAIAAGNFPQYPPLNGVAPGAQIVSMTIGDNRLGTQETAKALSRAMTRLMRDPMIHIVNTSYGEQSAWAPSGQIAKMMLDVVDKRGVVWISAAGNSGPCLSTIDSPAWICDDCIIGVSAYVSAEMMKAMYSHRVEKPDMSYTWTSRGPAPDGRLGISVCAPGGAITTVPQYTLMGATLMDGTSMATPHASALLLSKANQNCVPWTPYSVKKSLEHTALDVQNFEPSAQGAGLIQVASAYLQLVKLSKLIDIRVRFNVECSGGPPGLRMRGIYFRNHVPDHPVEYTVSVTPVFFQSDTIEQDFKIMYKKHFNLLTYDQYVRAPQFVEIHAQTTKFKVWLDPGALNPGFHHTVVDAFDGKDKAKGRMFTVDIFTIVPTPLTYDPLRLNPMVNFGKVLYGGGAVKRTYIQAPANATWAVLTMKTVTDPRARDQGETTINQIQGYIHDATFVVHVMTLRQGHIEDWECYKKVTLRLLEEDTFSFCVMGGKTLELVISRWWEEHNTVSLDANIKFFGVTIDKPLITASPMDTTALVELSSHLKAEEVQPSARLTHLVQQLQATDMSIKTFSGPRDTISPGKPIFELCISFEFSVARETNVVIESPLLCEHLYESEYLSQFWMLFNHSKKFLRGGAAFPKRFEQKLQQGKYIVRMCIRHKDVSALHRFMDNSGGSSRSRPYASKETESIPRLPVFLKMSLPAPIPLRVYPTFASAIGHFDDRASCDEHPLFPITIRPKEFISCYIRVLLSEDDLKKLPSTSGYCLEGKFNFSDNRIGKPFCQSDVKIYIPTKCGDLEEAEGQDEAANPIQALTPEEIYKICLDPSSCTNNDDMDAAISHLIFGENKFGLATKLLLYKFENHPCTTWTSNWNLKLRNCYEELGWTHCIFYLDTNWLVSNPPDYRLF